MKIKALVLEPEKKPYVKEIENTLEELQSIVGGYIQVVYPLQHDDDVVAICNEDGKNLGLMPNRYLRDDENKPYDILVGTFLLVNAPPESEDFESLTDKEIKHYTDLYSSNGLMIYNSI